MSLHLSTHVSRGDFAKPFECPACCAGGRNDVWINDLNGWYLHIAQAHDETSQKAYQKRKWSTFENQEGPNKEQKVGSHEEIQDWKPPSPDPHANEEFWVTGRDEDYEEHEEGEDTYSNWT
jgi:hypothetical protein